MKSGGFTNLIQDLKNQISLKINLFMIAIDGVGGSGKSTLAIALRQTFSNTVIVHLDDFYSPELQRADRTRLLNQVLQPLKNNQVAKYQKYDWTLKKLTDWIELQPRGLLIIEGVSTLHDDFGNSFDYKIWIDCFPEMGFQRGISRDINQYGIDTTKDWRQIWMPQEKLYLDTQQPQLKANFIYST